ncbi:ABC transporter substrate-binding protein [Euzebya sp.]|uniref:ABC transporter substrate-binding protein n=1 Tax=Euzebya sp. TaxID=1971409 RepID=UPI0035183DCC
MPKTLIRLVALLGALLLTLTACRSDDGDSTAETTDDAAGAEVAEEAATDEAEEEAEPTEATDAADEPTEATEPAEEPAAGGDVTTDIGVTEEACPDAVNPDNGCIYLASLSDLTVGPFASQGPQIVEAVNAFWQRVNDEGGIAGYDVNTTEFTRDHQYSPETVTQVYQEISDEILAITHLLGSPMGIALEPFLEEQDVLAAPGTWTSEWLFSPNILESGSTYCIDAMNAVDYALEEGAQLERVMAIHFPGDFGDDGAAGMQAAAEANGIEFIDVPTTPGADNQAEALSRLVNEAPDMVLIVTGPTELATIVGGAVSQGYEGEIYAQAPGFNEGLLESPVADVVSDRVVFGLPWGTLASDAPGTQAFLEAMGDQASTTAFPGWVWSYPLHDAMVAAAESGDLTRAGLVAAAQGLDSVDYEGILPEGSGNVSGEPNDAAVRTTTFAQLDGDAEFRVAELANGYEGPTATDYDFQSACYS